MIRNAHNGFYYDPDEYYSDDIKLLKSLDLNIHTINVNKPIQSINDDQYCVFYCLRLVDHIIKNKVMLSKRSLKKCVCELEKHIISCSDMRLWITHYIHAYIDKPIDSTLDTFLLQSV